MFKELKDAFVKRAYAIPAAIPDDAWDDIQASMIKYNPIPDVWVEKTDSVLSSIKAPRWMYILEAKQNAFFARRAGK